MNKRQLLSTVMLVAPLAMAGCSESGSFMADGMDQSYSGAVASASHEMGVFHFSAGHFGLAVQHFQSATATNPRSVEAWNGLAATYDKLGRFDLSERYYRRALVVDPQSAQTLNNLGFSYWLQGRYDLAMVYLREADEVDGGNRVIEANRSLATQSYLAQSGARSKPKTAADPVATDSLLGQQQEFTGPVIERTGEDEHLLVTRPETLESEVSRHQQAAAAPHSLIETFAVSPDSDSSALLETEVPAVSGVASGAFAESAGSAEPVVPLSPSERVTFAVLEEAPADPRDIANAEPEVAPVSNEALTEEAPIRLPELLEASMTDVQLAEANVPLPVTTGSAGWLADSLASYNRRTGARGDVTENAVAATASLPLIEVSNGAGRDGMAARLGDYLTDRGLPAKRLTNAESFDREQTTIYYSEGWRVYAMGLASLLPAGVALASFEDDRSDIRIEIGRDLMVFDGELIADRSVADDITG
jgi:hypothetical protein